MIVSATLEQLFHEFAGALDGVDVTFERHERGQAFAGTFFARYPLTAALAVDLDVRALRHAADPGAFVREYVDHTLRPFQAKLNRATVDATVAWQHAIEGP